MAASTKVTATAASLNVHRQSQGESSQGIQVTAKEETVSPSISKATRHATAAMENMEAAEIPKRVKTPEEETVLQKRLKTYREEMNPALRMGEAEFKRRALAFTKEQQRQLRLSEKEQDWTRAVELFFRIYGLEGNELKKMPRSLYKSGAICGSTQLLMSGASMIPAAIILAISTAELAVHPVFYANIYAAGQGAIAAVTPFVNGILQIPGVAFQEKLRHFTAVRSDKLSAPEYPVIARGLKEASEEFGKLSRELEALPAKLQRAVNDSNDGECVRLVQRFQAVLMQGGALQIQEGVLCKKKEIRHAVININYASQFWQSLNKCARIIGYAIAAIYAIKTQDAHAGVLGQIVTNLITMATGEVAAGRDDHGKQYATLLSSMKAVVALIEGSENKAPEDLTVDDVDETQFIGLLHRELGPVIDQLKENFQVEMQQIHQKIARIYGMDLALWKELDALADKRRNEGELMGNEAGRYNNLLAMRGDAPARKEAALEKLMHELDLKKEDVKQLEEENWLGMSPAGQARVESATDRTFGNFASSGLASTVARLRMPGVTGSQIAQRVGTSLHLVILGASVMLVVGAAFRAFKARFTEQGQEFPIHENALIGIVATLAILGMITSLLSGALVNEKVSRRKIWTAVIQQQEAGRASLLALFHPKQTLRLLWAIFRSMTSSLIAAYERTKVECAKSSAASAGKTFRDKRDKLGRDAEFQALLTSVRELDQHISHAEQSLVSAVGNDIATTMPPPSGAR